MSEQDVTLNEFSDEDTSESNEGWKSVKLEDVANKRSDNVNPDQVDLERHVGLEHIQPNTPTPDWEPVDGLSSTKRRFEAGDILFAKLRPNLEKSAQPGFEGISSTDIFPIVPRDGVNSKYLLYRLSSKPAYDHARRTSVGTRMPRTSWNLFSNFEFDLPPLEEQRKIASVLYTVDQAIQKTEEIVNQINSVQAGLTSHLFTKGPRDSDTTDSRLGPVATELPAHWETKTIGELYTDRQLGTDERGTSDDATNIDLIKMGNIGFGTWDFSEVEKIDRDPELLEESGLEKGDLLFNTRNTPELVGKTAVWEYDREAIYDNNLLRLRFGDRITSGHYVNYYLSSELGRRQLRSRVHGTTSVAAIYWSDLKQVTIPVPPTEEQTEIVDVLRTHDEVRRRNESYQSELQRLKHGLMQDLLSGEVRTHDKDIEILDDVLQYG